MAKFLANGLFGFFLLLSTTRLQAQISITASAGSMGPVQYTSLRTAFEAINTGTHKGAILVTITANITEATTATINAPNAGAADYSTIVITTTGSFTIAMNANMPLINLNAAQNVTIDGNNTLQLVNTNVMGNVISFNNDASNNVIKNTLIKGATDVVTGGAPSMGIVSFGHGTTTGTGNDNNTIDNCDIDGTGKAACCIYSISIEFGATSDLSNSGNIIKNSRLHDNINPSTRSSVGLFLEGASTGWVIQNNSFYFTVSVILSQQITVRSIWILPGFTTDAHSISGNFVGGSAPGALGSMQLSGNTNVTIGYVGIDVETGGAGNMIQNNTVRNIRLVCGGGNASLLNAGILNYIKGFDGVTSISNNTISNLDFTNSAGLILFNPIHCWLTIEHSGIAAPIFNVTNNTITNISGHSGGTGDVQLYGIRLETNSGPNLGPVAVAHPFFMVTGNTISFIAVPFPGSNSFVRGIGIITFQGGLSNAVMIPKIQITNNVIHSLTTSSRREGNDGACSGIIFIGAAGSNNLSDVQKISGNIIYNLFDTNSDDLANIKVLGIYVSKGIFDISENKIYELKNTTPGTVAFNTGLTGIYINELLGTSQVTNNFISLGSGQLTNLLIFGIDLNSSPTGSLNVLYNTITISGSGPASNNNSTAALIRRVGPVNTPLIIKNNIFQNTRTGSPWNVVLINSSIVPPFNWISDYNDLYTVDSAPIALWSLVATDLTAYQNSSGDIHSNAVAVNFVNASIGDLHLTGTSLTDINLTGIPLDSITTDFDSEIRNAISPKKGADEPSISCTSPVIITQPVTQGVCTGANVSFSVTVTGNTPSFQWRRNGQDIGNANSALLIIPDVNINNVDSYDVVVRNSCGTVTSSPASLFILQATSIVNNPVSQTSCAGSNTTFAVTAIGSGLQYQWRKAGGNIAGANGPSFVIPITAITDAGNYDVFITGTCGNATSLPALLTVIPAAGCTTFLNNIGNNISRILLVPNVIQNNAVVHITAMKPMKIKWEITDMNGRVILHVTQHLHFGDNDLSLSLYLLSKGMYYLAGYMERNRIIALPFFKK